jgi:hypothetical protein
MTDSMEQSTSSETDSRSAGQIIPPSYGTQAFITTTELITEPD